MRQRRVVHHQFLFIKTIKLKIFFHIFNNYINMMFFHCPMFKADLDKWDVSNVSYMSQVFYNYSREFKIPSWYKG